MKKIIICIAIAALVLGGTLFYHFHSLNSLRAELEESQKQEELLNQRINDIKESSDEEKKSLLKKIDDLVTEQVVVFDSGAIQEEIKEIGELATIEYRYTNVGTLDSSKTFKHIDLTIPLSKKAAIMTMDGVLKAGIDFSAVKIVSTDDTITITIPNAKILSNELDENSLKVYEENNGLLNPITIEDDTGIRNQIKTTAEQNAIENNLLKQAKDNAQNILRYMVESVPGVKGNYTIKFK